MRRLHRAAGQPRDPQRPFNLGQRRDQTGDHQTAIRQLMIETIGAIAARIRIPARQGRQQMRQGQRGNGTGIPANARGVPRLAGNADRAQKAAGHAGIIQPIG